MCKMLGLTCRSAYSLNREAEDLIVALKSASPAQGRTIVRQFNAKLFLYTMSHLRNVFSEQYLSNNYQIFDTFFRSNEAFFANKKPLSHIRYYSAHICFAMVLLLGILGIISWILFLIYSLFYPLLEFVRTLSDSNSDTNFARLPESLTVMHFFIMVPLLFLAPAVHKFYRTVCTDVVPLGGAGMPPLFFGMTVIKRMETIYKTEICWQYLASFSRFLQSSYQLFINFYLFLFRI